MAEEGEREPNPSTQLNTWSDGMRGTIAQAVGILQGLSGDDTLANLGNAWDK